MKAVLLILVIGLIFASCGGITQEAVALELEFRGPCSSLVPMISSIATSSFSSPGCLPITLSPGNPDLDDLDSHYHCVDVRGGRRSIFRFVEVFPRNNYSETVEGADGLPAGVTFIPSIISKVPFRVSNSAVSGQVSYWLRPTCSVSTDVCNGVTQIVNNCIPRRANVVDGYVFSDERVYIVLPNQVLDTCISPNSTGCCSYISTATTGICGGNGGDLCAGRNCNDNDPCTTDTCNALTGDCVYTPIVCNDNIDCTNDTCDSGNCIYTPINSRCDDNIACTDDTCSAASGCVYTNNNANCDDSVPCTDNVCQPGNGADTNGCVFNPNNSTCASGFTCSTGYCVTSGGDSNGCMYSNDDQVCADAFSCTADSCSPGAVGPGYNAATGCLNSPNDVACNDGKFCSVDTCNPSGVGANATTGCISTPNDTFCYDNSSCTDDYCDPFSFECLNPQISCNAVGCKGGCEERCVGNFALNAYGACVDTNLQLSSCLPTTTLNDRLCRTSSNAAIVANNRIYCGALPALQGNWCCSTNDTTLQSASTCSLYASNKKEIADSSFPVYEIN